jgi:hypothetical protein
VKCVVLGLLLIAGTARAGVEDDLRDGDRYFEDGDWVRAAAAFDRAIAKAPGQVPAAAYGKRATIFIITKSYKPGLDFIGKAKQRHPGAPEILEQEALILWETDRRDDAIAIAEQVVAQRPQAFTNQKLIGEHYAARDPAKTAAAFEAYLRERPRSLEGGDVLPRVQLGFAYLALARSSLADDAAKARVLYVRAADQFEVVQARHADKPNAKTNAENGLCAAYTGLERFDEAVTVCERITREPKRIDAAASAWFNLATAYLKRKNTRQARAAANEYVKLRKTEARGFLLLGDVLFENREWAAALEHYTRAEKLVKPEQTRERTQISIGLGKTYRRLPQPNVALAIEKLATAYATNPTSSELALELGGAYLESKQDQKLIGLIDPFVGSPAFANGSASTRAAALVLAGKARFNLRELDKARARFEEAQKVLPAEVAIRRALVLVINEQAAAAKDGKAARALLDQAGAIDAASPITLANLAVIALAANDCDAARQHLATLESVRGHDAAVRLRLLGRSYICGKSDPKRAAEAYAAAEKAAKRANATVLTAEIYLEWAPLLWDGDVDDAITKLEISVKTLGLDPEVGPVARRNLSLALYRRGWKRLREGKAVEAVGDFERARDATVLRGAEPAAFDLSYALALLDANRAADAAKLFKTLAARTDQASFLKPAFARMPQLFTAYANYRTGTLAARQQAAVDLAKLEGEGGFVRELLGGIWEAIAHDQWRTGQLGAAGRSLVTAEKYATGEAKRRIQHDRSALTLTRNDARTFEALAGNPVEALVNLGIVYDLLGRHRQALDLWLRARGRVQVRDLQKWIDAKKRIHGL